MASPSHDGPTISSVESGWVAGIWVLTALSTLFVWMRLVSRFVLMPGTAGWDDAVILVAWILIVTTSGIYSAALNSLQGISTNDPASLLLLPQALKLTIISSSFSLLAFSIPKLAVALLLIRLLNPGTVARVLLYTSSLFMITFAVVGVIVEYVQCDPIAAQWNPNKYPNVVCWSPGVQAYYWFFAGSYSVFTDFAYAIYPMVIISKLKMSVRRRIGLSIILGMGPVAGAFGIYKTQLFRYFEYSETSTGLDTTLYRDANITLWAIVEANIIMLAACVPSVSPAALWINKHAMALWDYIWARRKTRACEESREFSDLIMIPKRSADQLKASGDASS